MSEQPVPTDRIRTVSVGESTTVSVEESTTVSASPADGHNLGQIVHDLRTLEKHLSEVQGSMTVAYDSLARTVAETNTGITALRTEVAALAIARTEDAVFIANQKAVEAAKAHDRELDIARAQERATIVLELQAQKALDDATHAAKRAALDARNNKIRSATLGAILSAVAGLVVYLITGIGHQTTTSVATIGVVIGLLVLVAIGIAVGVKPEAGL